MVDVIANRGKVDGNSCNFEKHRNRLAHFEPNCLQNESARGYTISGNNDVNLPERQSALKDFLRYLFRHKNSWRPE